MEYDKPKKETSHKVAKWKKLLKESANFSARTGYSLSNPIIKILAIAVSILETLSTYLEESTVIP
jgi:hypothetical protein